MPDGATFNATGFDQLKRELEQLPKAVREKLLKGATATACSVIRAEAVARAPFWTGDPQQGHPPAGTLKKAIYQARVPGKCTVTKEVWVVNVRQGKKAQTTQRGRQVVNLDAFYAKWVEFGHYTRQPDTVTRSQRKQLQDYGRAKYVAPQPFMRPAYEIKKVEASEAFVKYITDRLPLAIQGMRFIKVRS